MVNKKKGIDTYPKVDELGQYELDLTFSHETNTQETETITKKSVDNTLKRDDNELYIEKYGEPLHKKYNIEKSPRDFYLDTKYSNIDNGKIAVIFYDKFNGYIYRYELQFDHTIKNEKNYIDIEDTSVNQVIYIYNLKIKRFDKSLKNKKIKGTKKDIFFSKDDFKTFIEIAKDILQSKLQSNN